MRTVLRSAAAALAIVAVAGFATSRLDLFDLVNPFESETVVRDHDVVLRSLEDLNEFHAATGEYQVVVDVEDRTRFVPDFLKGERTTFLAQGSVDAFVDLGGLGADSVVVSEDGRSVTLILPPASLDDPSVDHEASSVLDRDRGIIDRVGGAFSDSPTSDRELYLEARSRLAKAAAGGDLQARAEANTRAMLEDLLGTAGFDRVRVVFESRARTA